MAVRPIEAISVTSRTPESAASFAAELRAGYDIPVRTTSSAREAVAGADIVLCATNSRRPVLESGWLRPGTHINAIGPKFRAAHELPPDIVDVSAVIATDSLAQVNGFAQPFFLPDTSGMVELDQIVAGHVKGRSGPGDITLFCSVGLAGTEVVLANALFEQPQREP
jgi:alanine dehydrogenase